MAKGYIFKIISHASLGKMNAAIKTVHERSGKNRVKIFFDMLYCAKKYGAGYYDYQIFAFYNLNKEHLCHTLDQQEVQHLYEQLRLRALPRKQGRVQQAL